jgi:hypothetical protein
MDLHEGHDLVLCEIWDVFKRRRVKRLAENKDKEIVAVFDHESVEVVTDDTCTYSYLYCYTCKNRVDDYYDIEEER